MRRYLTNAALVSLLLCSGWQLASAWPNDPTVNVRICGAALDQTVPTIASDGAGGAIVAWQDNRAGGGTPGDIYARRVDAQGVPLWTADGVAICTATDEQIGPRIVADGFGGAIIAWQDARDIGTTGYDLYAQRVNASGMPLWTAGGVPVVTAASDQMNLSICSDGSGGAIVCWWDTRPGPGGTGMYAKRLDAATGAAVAGWGANGNKLNTGFTSAGESTIASDGAGGAIAVWADSRFPAGLVDLFAQHMTASGTVAAGWPAGGDSVSAFAGPQYGARAIPDGNGGVIVTWHDGRATGAIPPPYDIYAKRVPGTGGTAPGWTIGGNPICVVAGDQSGPVLVSDGSGGAIITWTDSRAGVSDIYAQRITASGAIAVGWLAGGEPLCTAAGPQSSPSIVSDEAAGAIVVWRDNRVAGAMGDCYGQHIVASSALAPGWAADGNPITTATGDQVAPSTTWPFAAADGNGGAIVTWTDLRVAGSADIYVQNIGRYGVLGNPEPVIARVRDVPNDQGGNVRVDVNRSYLDAFPDFAISEYWLWRQVPAAAALRAFSSGARLLEMEGHVVSGAAPVAEPASRGSLYLKTSGTEDFYWEFVTSQPARGFSLYSFVAPTGTDSVGGSNPRTVYMVQAQAAASPNMFWNSAPDSGYSVDNLAPSAPAPFVGVYAPSGSGSMALHWNPNPESDFNHYELYRGASADFVPGPGNLVASQADTGYVDANVTPSYYKLFALDDHGNRSPYALVDPTRTTDTPEGSLPREVWLGPAVPNPARARAETEIRFGLPRPGPVTLALFDARGRAVRNLIEEASLPAGDHIAHWDGRDANGRPAAAGLYFLRLEAGGQIRLGRLVNQP